MERAGLNTFGPILCGFFILMISLLIVTVVVILPIAVICYFMPFKKNIVSVKTEPKEIQEEDFEGW
jgi:hypothetical protein